ncbi:hypothetical protein ACRTDM_11265 [Shewanella algae]|uniref:hypothetical protein n=1 Tax=Shewanella algae TaxID=38313 RepID=UPI003003A8FD
MGYRVSSLKKTPKVPGIELYVFVVGDLEWNSGFAQKIMDNFNLIARRLGEKGAIVAPHDGLDLSDELSENVNQLACKDKDILDFLKNGYRNGAGLLLMSSHPDELTQDDLVMYSTIELLEHKFGSLEIFFAELYEFSNSKNEGFKNKFAEPKRGFVAEAFKMLDLNPNFCGIGINLNPLKDRLL